MQVLIDLGEGMEPFRRDQFALLKRIRETVGHSQTETLYFQDCPSRGAGPRGAWSWTKHHPPATGRPILVLSDLLIGKVQRFAGIGLEGDWITWAHTLAESGNPIVAFVPYPPARWPLGLLRRVLMIPWDRTTTARTLHALLRGLSRKPQWR
ncbi:hypothetical protein ACHMW5_36110 (plasmid) [Azospirillum melinis]|uniref:hypothetical protein n=1 Tax=Azospirillum melinis TaxID=328839 RepID=UPI0037580BFC